ncbi:hypothetical protein BDV26DRAFT_290948 [Aspergillus bertholletiae]|uniref:Uncharacterized protein n=1 Tax=Aspergillus bertholletiae TaxID=1226010 RepID=A0A5N7BDU9_9EURO|nr:hypothetical protein BDV26DRAFT_290948 [Aspergillus bertholletiae]
MKLQLLWFLTSTSLAFAGHSRRTARQEGIEKRGNAYDTCMNHLVDDTVSIIENRLPEGASCLESFKKAFETNCLAVNTNKPSYDRKMSVDVCINEEVKQVTSCLKAAGIKEEEVDMVHVDFDEFKTHAFSTDASIGCSDDA